MSNNFELVSCDLLVIPCVFVVVGKDIFLNTTLNMEIVFRDHSQCVDKLDGLIMNKLKGNI